jgi:hypothetical protein
VRAEEEVDQGRISGLVIVDWGMEEMEVAWECEWECECECEWRCCWNEGSWCWRDWNGRCMCA